MGDSDEYHYTISFQRQLLIMQVWNGISENTDEKRQCQQNYMHFAWLDS
jgi:hypothetical protein